MQIESKDVESRQMTPQFYYLSEFSEEELDALEKKYCKSRRVLEEMLNTSFKIIWLYRTRNWGAQLSTMLHTFFQITTGNEAIIASVGAVSPGIEVSDTVADGVSAPIALMGMIMYLFTFSPRKEAVRSALDYLCRTPFNERLKHAYFIMQHDKSQAAKFVLKSSVNQTVVQFVNATMTMTQVIGIMPYLSLLPAPVKGLLISIILHHGMRYFEFYTMPDYYKHLDEFWFNKKYPPLLSLLRQGKTAQFLRLAEQGLASVLLRVLTLYFLAEKSRAALGWWPNSIFIAVLGIVHSLIIYYPHTYKRYLEKNAEIEALLAPQIFNDEFKHLLRVHNITNPAALERACLKLQTIFREQMEKEIVQQQGWHFLQKIEIIVPILYDTAMGALFGYTTLAKLFAIESPVIAAFSTLCGAGLLGSVTFKSEYQAALDHQVYALCKMRYEAPEQKIITQNEPKTCATTTLHVTANVLNVATAMASALITVGGVSSLFGDSAPSSFIIATAVFAVQRAINSVLFHGPKVYKTMKMTLLPAPKTSPSVAKQGLFGSSAGEMVPQENHRSWLCWRRANAR